MLLLIQRGALCWVMMCNCNNQDCSNYPRRFLAQCNDLLFQHFASVLQKDNQRKQKRLLKIDQYTLIEQSDTQ